MSPAMTYLEEAGRTAGFFSHATIDYLLKPDGVLTSVTDPEGDECSYMTPWLVLAESLTNPLLHARDVCLAQLANAGGKSNGGG